jgi:hypothetical protein
LCSLRQKELNNPNVNQDYLARKASVLLKSVYKSLLLILLSEAAEHGVCCRGVADKRPQQISIENGGSGR